MPADSGAADLMDRYPQLVSQMWEAGASGVFEQRQPDQPTADPPGIGVGFADEGQARRAVAIAADRGLNATVQPVDTNSWTTTEPSQVIIDTPTGPVDFPIVSGASFGHGAHPTTRLALGLMSRLGMNRRLPGRVLDVGTGTGVLAIAAHHLGAESITAVDIDADARRTARANLTSNRVTAEIRSELPPTPEPADPARLFNTVVVNVLVPTHEQLASAITNLMAPDGIVVASGFLDHQRVRIEAAYRRGRADLEPLDEVADGSWQALTFGRSAPYPPPEAPSATASAGG